MKNDPYLVLQNACGHLIDYGQNKYPDRVPVELQEAFIILWQAQSAIVLSVPFDHPAALEHNVRIIISVQREIDNENKTTTDR
jgi:hypothetical protein